MKEFIKNICVAFTAQGISLIASVILSLILPKFLSIEEYGYWQLFIFYIGYSGFFHLGLNDGVYLRIGGKEYKKLNFEELNGELKVGLAFQFILVFFIIALALKTNISPERKSVVLFTAIYLLINNFAMYIGYIFQATNRTSKYSFSIIIEKLVVILLFALIIITNNLSFYIFVIAYIIAKLISLFYCILAGKEIIRPRNNLSFHALKRWGSDTRVGIKLMIANISSMLILGNGRFWIDKIWGIEAFGKISFSLSLTNFFLLFIQQISMVLFPFLRKTEKQDTKKIYLLCNYSMKLLFPLFFILYIPIYQILLRWLPQYKESLEYLIILLPICVFDGKMQLIYNTYFKVLHKENILMKYNIAAMAISLVLNVIGCFILHSFNFIIISMVFSIIIRSILSGRYLNKNIEVKINFVEEIVLVVLLITGIVCLNTVYSLLWCIISTIIYFYRNKKQLKELNGIFKLWKK